jgi:hypothetical protein
MIEEEMCDLKMDGFEFNGPRRVAKWDATMELKNFKADQGSELVRLHNKSLVTKATAYLLVDGLLFCRPHIDVDIMLRPALSVITNPQNHILSLDESQDGTKHRADSNPLSSKHKRVMFDPSGMSPVIWDWIVALLLSEKHETNPSTQKKRKYGETLDLFKSASAWDKFSLQRFAVDFKKTDCTPLNSLIKDPRWYDPRTADEPWFLAGIFQLRYCWL